jgi:hypothetical protein
MFCEADDWPSDFFNADGSIAGQWDYPNTWWVLQYATVKRENLLISYPLDLPFLHFDLACLAAIVH